MVIIYISNIHVQVYGYNVLLHFPFQELHTDDDSYINNDDKQCYIDENRAPYSINNAMQSDTK